MPRVNGVVVSSNEAPIQNNRCHAIMPTVYFNDWEIPATAAEPIYSETIGNDSQTRVIPLDDTASRPVAAQLNIGMLLSQLASQNINYNAQCKSNS